MKDKTRLILIVPIVIAALACNQNQQVQDQNKADTKQVAANKANDTNGLMQADTDSTQTLSTTNSNSNTNLNINR
jgi:hypothetical protein